MELNHEDKIALITGANEVIGFEVARHLGAQGVTVYLGARNLHLEEFAEEKLKADGADGYFIVNRLTLRRRF
jgi:NAD(P)-dependent dehydrogenase (short-subunit alcohol dehydrogenase family)